MKFLNEIDGADKVIQDSENRFVSDSEKQTWNSKADGTHNHDTDYADINHNHTGTYEPADSTILKDADIGVTVQGYNANAVVDASYVHTDNNYTTTEKNKLAGIAAGAEVNVNADWNSSSGDSQILNKPTIPDTSGLMPKSGGVLENYREKLVALSGTSTAINLSLGNVFTHSLTGNTTYSITNAVNGQAHSFTLIITQTATVRTLTFPASVKWQGGEIPDLSTANKTYVLTFMTVDGGTTWLGMFGGEFDTRKTYGIDFFCNHTSGGVEIYDNAKNSWVSVSSTTVPVNITVPSSFKFKYLNDSRDAYGQFKINGTSYTTDIPDWCTPDITGPSVPPNVEYTFDFAAFALSKGIEMSNITTIHFSTSTY